MSDVKVQTQGDVSRVQIASGGREATPAVDAPQAQHFAQVHGGAMSYDAGSGQMQHGPHMQVRVNGADLNAGSGILATARTRTGAPARELTGDTLVTLPGGMEAKLRDAEFAGYVRRDASGQYVEIGEAERAGAAPQGTNEEHAPGAVQDMQVEPFAAEVEQAIAEAAQGVPSEVLTPMLADYGRRFAESGSLEFNPEDIASKTGLSVEQSERFAQMAFTALVEQVNAELQQHGIDPDEFREWSQQNRPREFKAAIVNHVNARTLAGYRALAQQFLKQTTPDAGALNEAGIRTMTHPTTGRLLVYLDGLWQDAAAAARQGRI